MARTKQTPQKVTKKRRSKADVVKTVRRSEADEVKKEKKPRRYKWSTVAKREIRRYTGSGKEGTGLLIRKAPFERLVREYAGKGTDVQMRFKPAALHMLQEATEAIGVELLELTGQLAKNAKRHTIMPSDLKVSAKFFGPALKEWVTTKEWLAQRERAQAHAKQPVAQPAEESAVDE